MTGDRLLEPGHAEVRLYRDRDPMREHPAAVPVEYRREIDPTTRHRDVRHVKRPDSAGTHDLHFPQQVQKHRMGRVLPARVRLAVKRLDAHAPHQRAHVAPADRDARPAQQIAQHPAAGERMLQVQSRLGERAFEKIVLQRQLPDLGVQRHEVHRGLGRCASRAAVEHISGALQQLAARLGDLVPMHVVLLRDLSDCLLAIDRLDRHLCLKGRRVVAPGSSALFRSSHSGLNPRP